MLIESINDILDIEIDVKYIDTIPDEKFIGQDYEFRIKEVDGHRILYLEFQIHEETDLDE